MSGGSGKGPSQTGTATSTTTNKTADTLLPYTTYGLDSGKDVFQQNRDGTGYATTGNNDANQGYTDLYSNATGSSKDLGTKATGTLSGVLDGNYGVGYSPSYSSLYDSSYGGSSYQQGGDKAANGLYSLAYTDNPAYDTSSKELSNEANGDYLNSNPYIDSVYDTESKKITDKYQTATAPNTDSTYEAAGRYGSGAMSSARSTNEKNLGYSLDNLAADTYYKNYNDERGRQTTAANNLGTLGLNNTKLQGSLLDSAGTQYGNLQTGKTTAANDLQTGYNTGNTNTLNGLALYPATDKQTYYGPTKEIEAGKGLISQPYYNTSEYMKLIPGGYGSSSSKTDPIYGPSDLTTGTSLLGSGTSAYKDLSGGSSIGSLFGKGGSSAASTYGGGEGIYAAIDAAPELALAFGLSDRRAKTDIERVGELDNGLPVYSYRYKGHPRTQIGLIAQEVEKKHPEAVVTHPQLGLKMVDYSRAVE